MKKNYIVKLAEYTKGEPFYIADWSEGDPPRTYKRDSAKVFKSEKQAQKALNKANSWPNRDYPNAKIILTHETLSMDVFRADEQKPEPDYNLFLLVQHSIKKVVETGTWDGENFVSDKTGFPYFGNAVIKWAYLPSVEDFGGNDD